MEISDWLNGNAVLAFFIAFFFAIVIVLLCLLCWYGFISGFWSGVWFGVCTYVTALLFMMFVVLGVPVDSTAGTGKNRLISVCGFFTVDKSNVGFFDIEAVESNSFADDGLFDYRGVDPYPIISFLVKGNNGGLVRDSPLLNSSIIKVDPRCRGPRLRNSLTREGGFFINSASCDSKKVFVPVPLPDGHKELYLWYKCVRSNCNEGTSYNSCNKEWSKLQPYLIGEDLRLKGWSGYNKDLIHQFNVKLGEGVKMVGFIELLNWYECKRNSVVHHSGNSIATCQSEWGKLSPHLICFDVDFPIGLLRGAVKNIYSGQAQRGFYVDSETQLQVRRLASKGENAKLTEFKADKGPSVILIAQYNKEDITSQPSASTTGNFSEGDSVFVEHNLRDIEPVVKVVEPAMEGSHSSKSGSESKSLGRGGSYSCEDQYKSSSEGSGETIFNREESVNFSMEKFYNKLDLSGFESVNLAGSTGNMCRFPGASSAEVFRNTELGKTISFIFAIDDPRYKVLIEMNSFVSSSFDEFIEMVKDNPGLLEKALEYKDIMESYYAESNSVLREHIFGTHFISTVDYKDFGILHVKDCVQNSYIIGVDIMDEVLLIKGGAKKDNTSLLNIVSYWETVHIKVLSDLKTLPVSVNKYKLEGLRDFISVKGGSARSDFR